MLPPLSTELFMDPLHSLMSKSARSLYPLLLMVALIGVVLIGFGVANDGRLDASTTTHIVHDVITIVPALPATDEAKIRSDLQWWQSHIGPETLVDRLLRDVGIAMVVAVLLTLIIESRARMRLQEEVRSGVVEATLRRLIPPSVYNQVKIHVMGARVLKQQWNVAIEVYRDEVACRDRSDHYVCRTTIGYLLRSLTGAAVTDDLVVLLDQDISGSDGAGPLPRIESVKVGAMTFRGQTFDQHLQDAGASFQRAIEIPPESVAVTIVVRAIIRVPDTFVWTTTHLTDHAKVTVATESVPQVKFAVQALHPDRGGLRQIVEGHAWEFAPGLMPWQGFQIRSWLQSDKESGPQDAVADECIRDISEHPAITEPRV